MNKYLLLPLIFSLTSCSEVGDIPERSFDLNYGSIDLSTEIEGEWDKVCLLTPYYNNLGAEEVLGFKFDVETKSNIYMSDGISLLLVVKGDHVVEYFEVPRSNIDFSSLGAACYTKGNAKFKVIKNQSDWPSVEHT